MSTNSDALDYGQEQGPAKADSSVAPESDPQGPGCSACGRRDETLRAVRYPFVFSVIVVTFRRAFSGLWCAKHRNQRLFLASAITAMAGWIGIPFGLVWTPITLFKLARGGEQPADLNKTLLQDLADRKHQAGDDLGALRCLEASLRFGDDAATTERVRQLRARLGLPVPRPSLRRLVTSLPPALLGAFLVAMAAFTLDAVITSLGSPLLARMGGSIYAAILSWLPGIAIVFISGLILAGLTERAVIRLGSRGALLSGGVGMAIAVFSAYGLLEGYTLGYYASQIVSGAGYATLSEAVLDGIDALIMGATYAVLDLVQRRGLSATIYTAFAGVSLAYYLATAVDTALRTAGWRRRFPTALLPGHLVSAENSGPGRSTRRGLFLGCGASLLLTCLMSTCAIGSIQVGTMLASRSSLDASLDCPGTVHAGDTFEAVVTVHNPGDEPGADLAIALDGSLELDLFDGISVVQSDPPYSSHWEGTPGHHFYEFDQTVMAGETQQVTFRLKAERPGEFYGLLFVDVTTSAGLEHTPATPIEVRVLP